MCLPVVSRWYSLRRVWQWLATVVDTMRESIHDLRCDFLWLQNTQRERTRSRFLIRILAFLLVYHAAVSEKTPLIFRPIPNAEYMVLFVERFMAREVRCQTDTHNNYSNPRCACAPRVNNTAYGQLTLPAPWLHSGYLWSYLYTIYVMKASHTCVWAAPICIIVIPVLSPCIFCINWPCYKWFSIV